MEKVEIFMEMGQPFGQWRTVNLEIRCGGHKADAGSLFVHERDYPGGPRQAAVDQLASAVKRGLEAANL